MMLRAFKLHSADEGLDGIVLTLMHLTVSAPDHTTVSPPA